MKLGSVKTPNDIRYLDLLPLLEYVGFVQYYSKGDHVMFKHSKYGDIKVSVDSNSKGILKPCYVKNVYKSITDIIERGGIEL